MHVLKQKRPWPAEWALKWRGALYLQWQWRRPLRVHE